MKERIRRCSYIESAAAAGHVTRCCRQRAAQSFVDSIATNQPRNPQHHQPTPTPAPPTQTTNRDLATTLTAFTALKRLAKVDFLGEFLEEVGHCIGGWGVGRWGGGGGVF